MNYLEEDLPIELPLVDSAIIKVIGVGGGGGNAVNHMYRQGITDVSFVVCNTDYQALAKSPVPTKIQIGKLGAGGKPEVARAAAEENIEKIKDALKGTEMLFITATMGGGTGTGASPVIAKAAREMGILTIGIVTIPFAFELRRKIEQAMKGVVALSEHVDALLVINNEKLREIYPELDFFNAYAKADDVLTNAAKGIAEIITVPGHINIDFADVHSIMKDGNVAIMNTGFASGENRITKAIEDALNSPLLNTGDVSGASKILFNLYCSAEHQFKMEEFEEIHQFMLKIDDAMDVIWGVTIDESLGENIKITLIATGFDVSDIPGMPAKIKDGKPASETSGIEFTINGESIISDEEAQAQKEKKEKELIENAMGAYYGNKVIDEPEAEIEIDEPEDLPFITLDDLEDDAKREDIENTPAWKRQK